MLEVKPIQNKKDQEELCRICSLRYIEDAFAYGGYEGEKLIGALQFAIHGKSGYVYEIANAPEVDDIGGLFIMGRAALNFINLCGVNEAYFVPEKDCEPRNEMLVKMVGFSRKDTGEWYVNLDGFFTEPCKHHPADI